MGYGCFLDFAALGQLIRHKRLVSGFCSSGHDFAISSSRLRLTAQTLGVAMGFVGNYAPYGLSPQTDGVPVIPKKAPTVKPMPVWELHFQVHYIPRRSLWEPVLEAVKISSS